MKFLNIKLLALDFDGTLTDGFVYVSEEGVESVRCSRRDSLGINMLQSRNIPVIIISKEKNAIVRVRGDKMGVEVFSGVATSDAKKETLIQYCKEHDIPLECVVYIGDDVNDLGALSIVGYPVAVADADREVIKVARYTTKAAGGAHAVREVCDAILAG